VYDIAVVRNHPALVFLKFVHFATEENCWTLHAIKRLAKKLSFKTIQNGFRHTGASFYLAKTQNEYETARQLGHSVEILKRHYAGLVRSSEAEKFYQL
jgi:hypothetical protein